MTGGALITAGALYLDIRQRFRDAGLDTPELDARILLGEAIGIPASQLPLHSEAVVDHNARRRLEGWIEVRLSGMPVGRILGRREFWGLEFGLNEATLEPRPDTEILVEAVLKRTDPYAELLLVDVGTGSGAIAVSLLHDLPSSRCVALDVSIRALQQADRNARVHGVADRFWPVRGDYLAAIGSCLGGQGVDWVISNPPYIATHVVAGLADEVRLHDPNQALDGGADGLDAYRVLTREARDILRYGGRLAFEIGYDQGRSVSGLLAEAEFEGIEIVQDLSGRERVVLARKGAR